MDIKQFLFHPKGWNLPCLAYVKEFIDLGCGGREEADKCITELIKFSDKRTNEQCNKDGTNALINLIKVMNNK